jgi:hypothetical protein
MTDRILPPEEWHRLAGTEIGPILDRFTPARTAMLVVEEEGEIVGCWALLLVAHAEGVWISPAYRGGVAVARRLWRGMRRLVTGIGHCGFITGVSDEKTAVHALLAKRAQKLPQEYAIWV